MTNKMEKLITLTFNGHNIRTVLIDDVPWFVAADLSMVLYGRSSGLAHVYAKLDADQQRTITKAEGVHLPLFGKAGAAKLKLISESGLFKMINRSDKPQAKPFQDWVNRDVLPAIRRDGGYVLGQEDAKTPEEELEVLARFFRRKHDALQKQIDAYERKATELRREFDTLSFMMSNAQRIDQLTKEFLQ